MRLEGYRGGRWGREKLTEVSQNREGNYLGEAQVIESELKIGLLLGEKHGRKGYGMGTQALVLSSRLE